MKTNEIMSKMGICLMVGAASAAGSALWTTILERKFHEIQWRVTRPKANNVIDCNCLDTPSLNHRQWAVPEERGESLHKDFFLAFGMAENFV